MLFPGAHLGAPVGPGRCHQPWVGARSWLQQSSCCVPGLNGAASRLLGWKVSPRLTGALLLAGCSPQGLLVRGTELTSSASGTAGMGSVRIGADLNGITLLVPSLRLVVWESVGTCMDVEAKQRGKNSFMAASESGISPHRASTGFVNKVLQTEGGWRWWESSLCVPIQENPRQD